MKKYGKKGFTLIELIAVLVIMAIIALIATPLVMSVIRKAKIAADKRSVDAYGRSVELAIASYLLDTGTFPTDLHSLTIEYSGNTVVCNVMTMKENGGLYMSECSVNNVEVKDDSTEDGWYHYGTRDLTNEEYVDMYGKNVEDAVKVYHDTNNAYPDSIDTLTIKSVGKTVACESSVNYDGTVYLTNCKVDGVSVADTNQEDGYYHYGVKAYSIGDEITYNGIQFYVIENSDSSNNAVTMLKAEPLTVDEVNRYGTGHINKNTGKNKGIVYNNNGYGFIAYYSGVSCGADYKYTECVNQYELSDIKYVVDNWADGEFNDDDLIADSTGYKARLLRLEEMVSNLGYVEGFQATSYNITPSVTPSWVYSQQYQYWTMSTKTDSNYFVWDVGSNGTAGFYGVSNYSQSYSITYTNGSAVRPVITIKKSAL